MDLADLLDASGGLLDAAYSVSAEITRMTVDGSRIASIDHIVISDISESNRSNSVFFEPYDHLHIKRIPYWSENQTVTLAGEFLFPGIYRIYRGESLSDVVAELEDLPNMPFPKEQFSPANTSGERKQFKKSNL